MDKTLLDKTAIKIGWIGTGVMGLSMCKHILKAGFNLTVSNRTMLKTEPLVELGAKASDPISIAKEVDFLFLMLGYPKDVEEMVLGNTGILPYMKKSSYLIDHTTSSPDLAARIFNESKTQGIYSYDAPVTGGDIGAREGKLITLVGGEEEHFSKLQLILNLYSKEAKLVGSAGVGQHTKMVNQIAISSTINGLCEALLYAHKAGLNLKTTIDLIAQGAAASTQINAYGYRILNRDFEAGFFAEHLLKDIEIAVSESKRMGLNLQSLQLAQKLYTIMVNDGLSKKGHHGLLLTLEKLNGIDNEIENKK
jgi:3-hydroxyisobutyrate dehydrogenase